MSDQLPIRRHQNALQPKIEAARDKALGRYQDPNPPANSKTRVLKTIKTDGSSNEHTELIEYEEGSDNRPAVASNGINIDIKIESQPDRGWPYYWSAPWHYYSYDHCRCHTGYWCPYHGSGGGLSHGFFGTIWKVAAFCLVATFGFLAFILLLIVVVAAFRTLSAS